MKPGPNPSNGVEEQVELFVKLENALDAQIEAVLQRNRQDLEKATADLERLVDQYQVALLNQQVASNSIEPKAELHEATQRVRRKLRRAHRLIEASLKFFEEQFVQFARLATDGEYTHSGRNREPGSYSSVIEIRS